MATKKDLPVAWQRSASLTTRQPIRAAWLALNLLILALLYLPLWSFRYSIPLLRPDAKWTWRQALVVRLFKFHFTFTPTIWPQFTAPCQPGLLGGEEKLFELIEPAPEAALKDFLGPGSTSVRATSRPGSWYPSLYEKDLDSGKKVLLYFFGGAYVVGGHAPSMYQGTLQKLLPALGNAKFFSVGYRLASSKGNHFPAQLVDAVSAYHHILRKGIRPARIVLLGDSAGGNLVLALLRYMTENKEILPLPAAACLACPWVDLSYELDGLNKHPNARCDIITPRLLRWGVEALVPPDTTITDRYISPGLHPFRIPVPMWIQADENEILCESIVSFAVALRSIPMNDVELIVHKGGTHATLMWGAIMGFHGLLDRSVESIRLFLLERRILEECPP